ncbi:MAG: hypothetical protein J1E02_09530 [Coprobacter sp.]|nr:hypothetical protein [Coprobacter sp.]
MKNLRKFIAAVIFASVCSGILTSCGAFSNMSDEDAFNVGWGAGTLLRNMIDN